jgi:putative ABC transport system permease protein
LRALRRHTERLGAGLRSYALLAAGAAAAFAFVLLLTVTETESLWVGVWFTAAVGAALVALAGVARLAMVGARLLRRLPRYHLRQGIANLYRPGNQTIAVISAVGTGVLLLASIAIIERSLQEVIAVERREELPNLFIIDIQPDQRASVEELAARSSATVIEMAPMISAHISRLNGRAIDKTRVERNAVERNFEDTLRTREYFLSYRDHPIDGEEVTEGRFWSGRPARQEASIDERMKERVGVELGDTLTLDVQGIPIDAVVTSFRRIRWQTMRPNSMILLSPGEIEKAPTMFVSALRVPERAARYALQDHLVRRFPNLTVVDVTDTAATVRLLVERISAVFSVLGLLTLVTGAIILGGAIAAGRYARQRESVLLKVLGASRSDLRRILVTEYATLAILGAACGWALAEMVTRPALEFLFETPAVVPYGAIALLLSGAVLLNVTVGIAIGRGVARRSALDIMREE